MGKNAAVVAQLAPLKQELQTKVDAIRADLGPDYAERDRLLAALQPLEAQLRAVQQRIKTGEAPMREALQGLAQIARAEGGARSLPLDAGATAAAPGDVG
jgi:hypothetical protein